MNFKCCTFENVALILAVVHVLLGRGLQNKGEVAGVVLLYASYFSCCNSKMVKIGVAYIYGRCRKIKTRVPLFGTLQRWNRVNGSAILAGSGRVTGQCVRPGV